VKKPRYSIDRTEPAMSDIEQALDQSFKLGGKIGQRRYAKLLPQSVKEIGEEPRRLGARNALGELWTYHARHSKTRTDPPDERARSPRHLLLYRIDDAQRIVIILRLLHDSMDLPARVIAETISSQTDSS
jgi:plasmid stabilization system protein ParE